MQRQRQACAGLRRLGSPCLLAIAGKRGRAKGPLGSRSGSRTTSASFGPLPTWFPAGPYVSGTKLPWNPNGIRTGRWIVATGGALKSCASITITSLVFVLES